LSDRRVDDQRKTRAAPADAETESDARREHRQFRPVSDVRREPHHAACDSRGHATSLRRVRHVVDAWRAAVCAELITFDPKLALERARALLNGTVCECGDEATEHAGPNGEGKCCHNGCLCPEFRAVKFKVSRAGYRGERT